VSCMTSAVGDVADIDSPPPILEEGDCAPFCSSWDFIAFPSPPIEATVDMLLVDEDCPMRITVSDFMDLLH
jgi:hypothetical protein